MSLLVTGLLIGSTSFADSFSCKNENKDLSVVTRGQNKGGTRTASVMIISDPTKKRDRTIAAVTQEEDVLQGTAANAYFDVAEADEQDMIKDTEILGVDVENAKTVSLSVPNFKYGQGDKSGTTWKGVLTVTKKKGVRATEELKCVYRTKG